MITDDVIALLADAEHERWSHWQRYMHSRCERREDGALVIPAELVARWETQMTTSYHDLTEKEQQSDIEQVQRYLPIVRAAFASE